MAKYTTLENGKKKLVSGLSQTTGAADANKIIETGADGKIDPSFLPDQDLRVLTAGEALAAGDFVHIDATGNMVKADFSNGRGADGYILETVASGATGTMYFEGVNSALTGLTPGNRYYLDTTGTITDTPKDPLTANAGEIHQYLGKAVSASELQIEIQDCVIME